MAQTQSDKEARIHTKKEEKKTRGRQDRFVLPSKSTTDAEERWPEHNDDAGSPAEPLCTPRKPLPPLVYTAGSTGSLAAAEHRSEGEGSKRLDATLLEQHGVDHVHVLLSSGEPESRMRPTIMSREIIRAKSSSSETWNEAYIHTGDGKRHSVGPRCRWES